MTKYGIADNAILIRGKWIQVEPRKPLYPRALAAAGRILEQRLEEQRQRIRNGTFFKPEK